MEEQDFERLLGRPESEYLDFKRELWKLSTEEGRTDFLKDVISMANTPRDGDAHIVIGVSVHANSRPDPVGISEHVDDANLQQQFDGKVHPTPVFRFQIVSYRGKNFGLITVPPATVGPSLPLKDLPAPGREVLRRGVMYLRRGSRNTVGDQGDYARFFNWLSAPHVVEQNAEPGESGGWTEFLSAVHKFDLSRAYVLVASPIWPPAVSELDALAGVPWVTVIDLDPKSDRGGLASATASAFSSIRAIRRLATADDPITFTGNGLPWVYARGMEGRSDATPTADYRQWLTTMQSRLNGIVARVASFTLPRPHTAVVAAYDPQVSSYIRSISQMLLATYGNAIDIVFVTDDTAALGAVADDLGIPVYEIPFDQLTSGLASLSLQPGRGQGKTLPSVSGAPQSLAVAETPWIEEELEVLYLETGRTPTKEAPLGRGYLMGEDPDWYDIALHVDVDREKYNRLRDLVDRELKTRAKTVRINLYHFPGAGGSTVGRRLLWDLHFTFPCVILKGSHAQETTERLGRVHAATQRPVLLMADSGYVPERVVDDLFERLRSRQIPVVILQVLRRFSEQDEIARVVSLPPLLTEWEASRFVEVYSRDQTAVRQRLEALATSDDPRDRTAFSFGLATYGRDYQGLPRYVAARLDGLPEQHREVLLQIAMVHHYAQDSLPSDAFGDLLEIPLDEAVEFEDLLAPQALELLVSTSPGRWRTAHELFAQEIIEQTLGVGERRTWRNRLPDAALALADTLRGKSTVPSELLLETARRAFVYRDNVELLGTERSSTRRFSQLIEDIAVPNASAEVLLRLTVLYQNEAHFAAHLARLYAYRLRDYNRARQWIERAIAASDDRDSVLHHMKGMILRVELYDELRRGASIADTVDLRSEASEAFARARELRPDGEHGYISEIQMLIRVLQSARDQLGYGRELVYSVGGGSGLAEAFERAEDLLAQVRRMREGEGESTYERECRAQLDGLYGRHDRAVQQYMELLRDDTVYKPPIRRQLVWTYLHHRGRDWNSMSSKELRRISGLLDQNLRDEPENEANIRLWVRAVRYLSSPPSIDEAIERLELWRSLTGSLESTYYLAVFSALRAMQGSGLALDQLHRYQEDTSRRAQFRRDRTRSIEWLGQGEGVRALVHQSELGPWDDDSQFYRDTRRLGRIEGRVVGHVGPQAGTIELEGSGVHAFYIPSRLRHTQRSLNQRVTCFLGFSYEGPRAWSVHEV